jgi:hypothetical protein
MPDPQWTVEVTVLDNKTGARRVVQIDAPDLPGAFIGAVQGMAAVVGAEAQREVGKAFGMLPPEFRAKVEDRHGG